jgi:hypothetical protein
LYISKCNNAARLIYHPELHFIVCNCANPIFIYIAHIQHLHNSLTMTISVRIVNIDHYMAKPGPFDRSFTPFSEKKLTKVPIIRVFGSTLAGQKLCLHIHQVK